MFVVDTVFVKDLTFLGFQSVNMKENIAIKGSLEALVLHRYFIAFVITFCLGWYFLGKLWFQPSENSDASGWLCYALTSWAFSGFAFWLLTGRYYYYAFGDGVIYVKNRFTRYSKTLPLQHVQVIKLYYGGNYHKLSRNSAVILYYDNQVLKNRIFYSYSYGVAEWRAFVAQLKKLNVSFSDPEEVFFRSLEEV